MERQSNVLAVVLLLLCSVTPGAGWSFVITNVELLTVPVQTPIGMVVQAATTSVAVDPSRVYFLPSTVSCSDTATGVVFSVDNPTVVNEGITFVFPISSDYTVGVTYTVCYVEAGSHLEAGSFAVIASNPTDVTFLNWRSGVETATFTVTGDPVGRGATDPKIQRCGATIAECGALFSGALSCETDASYITDFKEVSSSTNEVSFSTTVPILSEGVYRVCYYFEGMSASWRQLPRLLEISGAFPNFYYVNPFPDSTSVKRQDSINVYIAGDYTGSGRTIQAVSFVSNESLSCEAAAPLFEMVLPAAVVDTQGKTLPGAADGLEIVGATLRVTAAVSAIALCVEVADGVGGVVMSRVPLLPEAVGLAVLAANPTACTTLPTVPRQGQHVDIDFAITEDIVGSTGTLAPQIFFETEAGICDGNNPAGLVQVLGSNETGVTVLFETTGVFVICLQKAPVQNHVITTKVLCPIKSSEAVPTNAQFSPSKPAVMSNVNLSFSNRALDGTVLNLQGPDDPPGEYDLAILVPSALSCAAQNVASDVLLSPVSSTTLQAVFSSSGCYRVCYKLTGGVWSDTPVVTPLEPDLALLCEPPSPTGGNVVFVYPQTPSNYTIVTPSTDPQGGVVLEGNSTFRLDFNEPSIFPKKPDATDTFKVVPYTGTEESLTLTILAGVCSGESAFSGNINDEDRREATLHLEEGSYVICYALFGYSPVPVKATNFDAYIIVVAKNPVAMSGLGFTLRARQTFVVTLNVVVIDGLADQVLLYSPEVRYCDIAAGYCRCPSQDESRTKIRTGEALPPTQFRIPAVTSPGDYLLCYRFSTLLDVVTILPALPFYAVLSEPPRQDRPFTVEFADSDVLAASVEVQVLIGQDCDCSSTPLNPCEQAASIRTGNTPRTISLSLKEGQYTACYFNNDFSRSQTKVYFGEVEQNTFFDVAQADPSSYSFSVAAPSVGKRMVVTLVQTVLFKEGDAVRFLQAGVGVSCNSIPSDVNATDPDGIAEYSGVLPGKQAFLVQFVAEGTFVLCHRGAGDGFWVGVPSPQNFTVAAKNPHTLVSDPPAADGPSVGQSIDITLQCSAALCSEDDQVLVMDVLDDCDSFLTLPTTGDVPGYDTTLLPNALAYNSVSRVYWNNATTLTIRPGEVSFHINEIFETASGTLKVCYRRLVDANVEDGNYWTQVGEFAVADMDPKTFSISPSKPTAGEYDVVVTFDGASLSDQDDFFFTHHSIPCFAYNPEDVVRPGSAQQKEFSQQDGTTTWKLISPVSNFVYTPAIPTGFEHLANGETAGDLYNRSICYIRGNTRLSRVGTATFEGFGPLSPTSFEIEPSTTCPGCNLFLIDANVTVRLLFFSDTVKVSDEDEIKLVAAGAPCNEGQPAAPSSGYSFPLLKPIVPICSSGCLLTMPATFSDITAVRVCYRHAGRSFSAMTKIISISAPSIDAFSYIEDKTKSMVPSTEMPELHSAGEEVLVTLTPDTFLEATMEGYLVEKGAPCLLTPDPTNPERSILMQDLPSLPFFFNTLAASQLLPNVSGGAYSFTHYLSLVVPVLGSYDLCVNNEVEYLVTGSFEVGPASPSQFTVLNVAEAFIGGVVGDVVDLSFQFSASSLSLLPLGANDVVVVTNGTCTNLAYRLANPVDDYLQELPVLLEGGGATSASWVVNGSGSPSEQYVVNAIKSGTTSFTVCYQRQGRGYATVPAPSLPIFSEGFASADTLPQAFTDPSGITLQTHLNQLAGLGSYALLQNATAPLELQMHSAPAPASVTVTMWVHATMGGDAGVLNIIDFGGLISVKMTASSRLALYAKSATGNATDPLVVIGGDNGVALIAQEWAFLSIRITRDTTPREGSVEIRVNNAVYATYSSTADNFALPFFNETGLYSGAPGVRLFGGTVAADTADHIAKVDEVKIFASSLPEIQLVEQLLAGTDLPGYIEYAHTLRHKGPTVSGQGRVIFKKAATVDPPAALMRFGSAIFTFRAIVHEEQNDLYAKSLLTGEDHVFMVAADQQCVMAGAVNATMDSTSGVAADFVFQSVTLLGEVKLCYDHKHTDGVEEFAGFVVHPASPSGVTYAGPVADGETTPYFYSGQQMPLRLDSIESDPLGATDIIELSATEDCSALTGESVIWSEVLRAPRWQGVDNVVYHLCYRRASPPSHPLYQRWVPVALGAVVIVPQHPFSFSVLPEYSAGETLLQAGVLGQTVELSPRGVPIAQDRVYMMLMGAAEVPADSPGTDPCMYLRPANSSNTTFFPDPQYPILESAIIPSSVVHELAVSVTTEVPSVAYDSTAALHLRVCYRVYNAEGGIWGSLAQTVQLVAPDPATYTVSHTPVMVGQAVDVSMAVVRDPATIDIATCTVKLVPEAELCSAVYTEYAVEVQGGAVVAPNVRLTAGGVHVVCFGETVQGKRLTRRFETPLNVVNANPSKWNSTVRFPSNEQNITLHLYGNAADGFGANGALKLVQQNNEFSTCAGDGIAPLTLIQSANDVTTQDIELEAFFLADATDAVRYLVCFQSVTYPRFAEVPGGLLAVGNNPWARTTIAGVQAGDLFVCKRWGSVQAVVEFEGTNFTATDSVVIVPFGTACSVGNGISVPTFFTSDTTARVALPQDLPPSVQIASLCYNRNGEMTQLRAPFVAHMNVRFVNTTATASPRVGEIIEINLASRSATQNFDQPNFYVADVSKIGKITTADKTGMQFSLLKSVPKVESIAGEDVKVLSYAFSFPLQGEFALFMDDAAVESVDDPNPTVFTVAEKRPSSFSPTEVRGGQEVVFTLINEPSVVETAELMLTTDAFCQVPCPTDECVLSSGLTTFSLQTAVRIQGDAVTLLYLCYFRGGGGWMPLDGNVTIAKPPTSDITSCPVSDPPLSLIHWGHNVSVSVTFRTGVDAFTPEGAYNLVLSTGALCSEGPEYSQGLAISQDGTTGSAFFPLVDATGVFADSSFAVCLHKDGTSLYYRVEGSGRTFTLLVTDSEDTAKVETRPATLLQGMVGGTIVVNVPGVSEVLFVPGTDRGVCMESCTVGSSAVNGVRAGSALGLSLQGNVVQLTETAPGQAPLAQVGDFVLCYVSASATLLTYLDTVSILPNVPSSYKVRTGATGGENITVTVSEATDTSTLLLLPDNYECGLDTYPDARAVLPVVERIGAKHIFETEHSLDEIQYRMCYKDEGYWTEAAYGSGQRIVIGKSVPTDVIVEDESSAREGVPISLTVSGIDRGIGDKIVIIAAGTACGWSPEPVCPTCTMEADGTPHLIPTLTKLPLREGSYEVCYKRAGAVFSKIFAPTPSTTEPPRLLSQSRVIVVQKANPASFTLSPAFIEVGTHFTLHIVGEDVLGNPDHQVRLLRFTAENDAVPSDICETGGDEVATWKASDGSGAAGQSASFAGVVPVHFYNPGVDGIPSSGSDALFSTTVCFKFTNTTLPWVGVPAYPSLADTVTVMKPNPYQVSVSPGPGRSNVLNLEVDLFTAGNAPSIGDILELREDSCGSGTTPLFSSTSAGHWVHSSGKTTVPVGALQGVDNTALTACYVNASVSVTQTLTNTVSITAARPTFFRITSTSGGGAVSQVRAGTKLYIYFEEGPSSSDAVFFPRLGDLGSQPALGYSTTFLEERCAEGGALIALTVNGAGTESDFFYPTSGVYTTCYRTGSGALSVVGAEGTLATSYEVQDGNPVGFATLPVVLYAGQTARVLFEGTDLAVNDRVNVIRNGDCWSNPVDAAQPRSVVHSASTTTFNALSSIEFTATAAENFTLCYSLQDPANPSADTWSVVGGLGGLIYHAPNPAGYTSFPAEPRIRQKVTITVVAGDTVTAPRDTVLEGALTSQDAVKVVGVAESCEVSAMFGTREAVVDVDVNSGAITWAMLQGDDDYVASFLPFVGKLCYKIAMLGAGWVPVGGLDSTAAFTMLAAHPETYATSPTPALIGQIFALTFHSSVPFLNGGEAKVVSEGKQCDAPSLLALPQRTSQFFSDIAFPENPAEFNVTVCYKLPEATYAALPDPLSLTQQPIKCAELSNPTTGDLYAPTSEHTLRYGQLAQIMLQPLSFDVNVEVSEIKFVQWGQDPTCTETPEPVSIYPIAALQWEVYFSHTAASEMRLCWRDAVRNVWIPTCTHCDTTNVFPDCRVSLEVSNPQVYVSLPSPAFTTQRVTMQLTGVGLAAGDQVSLHTAGDGYVCNTPHVVSYAIDATATVEFDALSAGIFHVCYGVQTEFGKVQMSQALVISNFAGCSLLPALGGGAPGSNVTNPFQVDVANAETRRRTRIYPQPQTPPDGFFPVTVDDATVQLGLSSSPECREGSVNVTDRSEGVFIQGTFNDTQVGAPLFACLKPDNGAWGTMCKIEILPGQRSTKCTAHTALLEGQYITVTPPSAGKVALVKTSAAAPALCDTPTARYLDTIGEGVDPHTNLQDAMTRGDFLLCFLPATDLANGLSVSHATEICQLQVEERSPTEAIFPKMCNNEGSRVDIDIVFPENHPLNVKPSVNDRYAIVASPDLCHLYDDTDNATLTVSAIPDALVSQLSGQALAAGEWSVCYKIEQGGWVFLNNITVHPPNPAALEVSPANGRAGQLLLITYSPRADAQLYPESDRVRYVRQQSECLVDTAQYDSVTGTNESSTTESTAAFNGAGDWHACYRLDDCPAAALSFTVTPYHPTNCVMPPTVRAGFSFQILVTSTTERIQGNGKVKLVKTTCTDAEPPAPGTTELDASLSTLGAQVTVPFFVSTTIFEDELYQVCYQLEGEPYAHIGGTCMLRLRPRNPVRYSVEQATVTSRRRFNITFFGDALLQGDRAQLILASSGKQCADITGEDGVLVNYVDRNSTWYSKFVVKDAAPHIVCYFAVEGQAWVQLPEPLAFAPSNPMRYEVVPAGFPRPLDGDVFELHFHKATDEKGTVYADLMYSDVLLLETTHGESHTYVPDRIINSGATAVFAITLRNQTFSVRYGSSAANARDPDESLYFEDLLVHRNPYTVSLSRKSLPRARQRITLEFQGRGLVAPVEEPNETPREGVISDRVVVMVVNTTYPGTGDAQCESLTTAPEVLHTTVPTATPLYAASDGSTKVDIILPTPGAYIVCYARKGDSVFLSVPFATASCSTVCAMTLKLPLTIDTASSPPVVLAKGTRVHTLEEVPVQVKFNATPGWLSRDYVVPINASDVCGPYAAAAANASALVHDSGSQSATLQVRFNVTGQFQFCYVSPQIQAADEWTELLPVVDVVEASPDGFQVSTASPRSGGNIVTVKMTDKGTTWRPSSAATRLGALLDSVRSAKPLAEPSLSVVQGTSHEACTGQPSLPSWATLVSESDGEYNFTFANLTASDVSFCVTTLPCPARENADTTLDECTRFLGTMHLDSAGMTGFFYSSADSEIIVHGGGLSSADVLLLTSFVEGETCTGVSGSTYSPVSVSSEGTTATFEVAVVEAKVMVCYQMADQASAAPVANLQLAGQENAVQATYPTEANCSGSASGAPNSTLSGSFAVNFYRDNVLQSARGSALQVSFTSPTDSVISNDVTWDASYATARVSSITTSMSGVYQARVKVTLTSSAVFEVVCPSFVVAEVTDEPVATETDAPPVVGPVSTPTPTASDDCSGNELCTYHIIILVCVLVFGLVIVIVAVVVLWKRDPTPDIKWPEMPVVPTAKPAFHDLSAMGTHTIRSVPEFIPTSEFYKNTDSTLQWDPLKSIHTMPTTPPTALRSKGDAPFGTHNPFAAPLPMPLAEESVSEQKSAHLNDVPIVEKMSAISASDMSRHSADFKFGSLASQTPQSSGQRPPSSHSKRSSKKGKSVKGSKGGSEAPEEMSEMHSASVSRSFNQVESPQSAGLARRTPSKLPPMIPGPLDSKVHDHAFIPPQPATPAVTSCEHCAKYVLGGVFFLGG